MKCPKCDSENVRLKRTYICFVNNNGENAGVDEILNDQDVYTCLDCGVEIKDFKEFKIIDLL